MGDPVSSNLGQEIFLPWVHLRLGLCSVADAEPLPMEGEHGPFLPPVSLMLLPPIFIWLGASYLTPNPSPRDDDYP